VIDCFLYDVRENAALRQYRWERREAGNGNGNGHSRGHKVQRTRSPLRFDCAYLVTAWATHPEDEHRMLSWCLWALARHPVLKDADLPEESKLRGQPYPIQAQVACHDKLTNPAEVWSSLDNAMRPGFSYVVTLALQPWEPLEPQPIVRAATWRTGQAAALPQRRGLAPDKKRVDKTYVCGVVWGKGAEGALEGQAGVEVRVAKSAVRAVSDDKGRYTLGSLPPGEHAVLVQPPGREAIPKTIVVPQVPDPFDREAYRPETDSDYDLVL
jgi:hypothetical protein